MDIHEIKSRLVKKATGLSIGGFKPTYSEKESWIGKVYLFKEDEDIPADEEGKPMIPLLQLYVESLPFIPPGLENTRVLTLFIQENMPMELAGNGDRWVLREYGAGDQLVIRDINYEDYFVRPFPLKATLIGEDYPLWDGGGIPADLEEGILELEKAGVIEDYYNVVSNHYSYKLGGYPTFCQPGIDFGEDYEFMLQVASDEKARLNIIDGGTIFLAKNRKTGEWKFYCDFH